MKTRIRMLPNGTYCPEYKEPSFFDFLFRYRYCYSDIGGSVCGISVTPIGYKTYAEAKEYLDKFVNDYKDTELERKALATKIKNYKTKYFTY